MSFQTASTLAASPIVEVTRQTNTVETATTDWKDPTATRCTAGPGSHRTQPVETSTNTMATGTSVTNEMQQVKLVDAVIQDQNTALNVIVGFIGVAQKRGAFQLDESAKLFECLKMFQGDPSSGSY